MRGAWSQWFLLTSALAFQYSCRIYVVICHVFVSTHNLLSWGFCSPFCHNSEQAQAFLELPNYFIISSQRWNPQRPSQLLLGGGHVWNLQNNGTAFPHHNRSFPEPTGKLPFPSLRWSRSKSKISSRRRNPHPFGELLLLLLSFLLDLIQAGCRKESKSHGGAHLYFCVNTELEIF